MGPNHREVSRETCGSVCWRVLALKLGIRVFWVQCVGMKAMEVVEENGVLKLPSGVSLPTHARLAVLVLEPDEASGTQIARLAEASGAFDFLKGEPDIYSDRDILPGRSNPRFRQ